MTESEALKTLEDLQRLLTNYRHISKELTEANGMAIKALEKQIPKKPNKATDRTWGIEKEVNVCPICDYYLTEVQWLVEEGAEGKRKVTYCDTCGQAIDWE